MKIKITQNVFGSSNKHGNETREYKTDEIVDCKEQWQKDIGKSFLDDNFAIEVKVADEPEKTVKKKVAKKKVAKK
tara:strand:- start:3667 stop:3891 length:225 start_codon:yes stop_codon:yes gene_type:complete